MSDVIKMKAPRKWINTRMILLAVALLTSPLCCLGGVQVLSVLPLPGIFSLFAEEAVVRNDSAETFTLTPITTTRGYPQVIYQSSSLRQCQVLAAPGESVTLTYDAADFPLEGVAACREGGGCRLLAYEYGRDMILDSYQAMPELDAGWQEAALACKPFNAALVLFPLLALVPLGAFVAWVVLTKREKVVIGK